MIEWRVGMLEGVSSSSRVGANSEALRLALPVQVTLSRRYIYYFLHVRWESLP